MAKPDTRTAYNAQISANKVPSLMVVSGTAGTADTTGTAEMFNLGGNPTTGALYVQDLSGASGTTNINGTVAISSIIPGTGATNLGKAEDNPHTTGDVGVMALGVRNDTGAVLAGNDGDYIPFTTDATGALRTDLNGFLSTNNSTTSVLAGGAVFTGVSDDSLNYNEIRISVITSHVSATDGLSIQQSSDNSNWDITDTYTIPATTGKTYSVPRQARYFRVVYTNGATLQTSFRLQTILNRLGARVSSQRPNDGYTNETDLEQTQSFNMLMNTSSTWDRQRGTLGTAFVAMAAGTMNNAGTIQGGTINNLATGTINALASGTITNGTVSVTTGTMVLNTGTITTIAAGTQNTLGTVGVVNNLATGTLAAVAAVTTVSNLTNGSVNILTGTVTLVPTVTTVSNLTNGSVNLLTGTVTRASNVGTLESGTVQLNPVPVPATLTFGTLGTAGGSFFATISAVAGAGTKHYVTGVDIVMQSGTADVRVLAGSSIQGTGVLAAGFFPGPGGGISNRFTPAFTTGTNSELIYHFVGAGTAFIRVSYWKGT